jgi:hypothetical protein
MNIIAAFLIFALPIAPGLTGFGTDTVAGSGRHLTPPKTQIYRVNSLADSGPGSLRECAEATGARTCIFEKSGYVDLKTRLDIKQPYLTIAGQTAPEGGIQLRGAGLKVSASDVFITHIGIRVGDGPDPDPDSRDGIVIWRDSAGTDVKNVVIDHVSVTWSLDENFSTYLPKGVMTNVTVSNSLFAEGLKYSIHAEDDTDPLTPRKGHSMAALIDHKITNMTFIGNLFAHNHDRHPRMKEAITNFEWLNNLIYNYGGISSWNGMNMTASPTLAGNKINFVGNFYKKGFNSPSPNFPNIHWEKSTPLSTRVYAKDNIGPARPTNSGDEWAISELPETMRSLTPLFPISSVIREPVSNSERVLATGGARPWARYASDSRIVREAETSTGTHKDCVAECPAGAGFKNDGNGVSAEPNGWPVVEERVVHHELPANPEGLAASGYTNLEEWIHAFPGALPPPLPTGTATATGTAVASPTVRPSPSGSATPVTKRLLCTCVEE